MNIYKLVKAITMQFLLPPHIPLLVVIITLQFLKQKYSNIINRKVLFKLNYPNWLQLSHLIFIFCRSSLQTFPAEFRVRKFSSKLINNAFPRLSQTTKMKSEAGMFCHLPGFLPASQQVRYSCLPHLQRVLQAVFLYSLY